MHVDFDSTEPASQIMEMEVRIVRQQGRGEGEIRQTLGNHQCVEPQTEGVVVVSGMPEGLPATIGFVVAVSACASLQTRSREPEGHVGVLGVGDDEVL